MRAEIKAGKAIKDHESEVEFALATGIAYSDGKARGPVVNGTGRRRFFLKAMHTLFGGLVR